MRREEMDILREGSNTQKGEHCMLVEENKALIRRFYEEVFNKNLCCWRS